MRWVWSFAALSLVALSGCQLDTKIVANGVTQGKDSPTGPAAPAQARPTGNSGTGFFVSSGALYDGNGQRFQIRGFSHTHFWGNDAANTLAVDDFPATHANTVRLITSPVLGSGSSPEGKQKLVEHYLGLSIVPMVEDHSATCQQDASYVENAVKMWTQPVNVAWLKKYESSVMLNITNEWGPTTSVYRDTYIAAVKALRAAGINALLVVDAGGCGQNIRTLQTYAKDILNADPQHNILFSIHLYAFWRTEDRKSEVGKWGSGTGNAPWDIKTELSALKTQGVPFIVGEFSTELDAKSVTYNTDRAMQIFKDLDIDWLAWSWGSNGSNTLDMTRNNRFTNSNDLTAWGQKIISGPLGFQATSKKATVFK